MTCRYDREKGDYIKPDGEPCRTDDYGDPTKHCTARRTCNQHIGADELTCARCIGRARTDLRVIVERAALMMPAALGAGVDSEAANLAGPAADPETYSARRRLDKAWIFDHIPEQHQERAIRNLIDDDDEHHPYSVLTRWQMMLSEDYELTLPARLTTTTAAGFLEQHLGRVAQDDEQDFPLLARELRKCRNHLEVVLGNSQASERGAPCPDCTSEETGVGPRLVREYSHWCDDPLCERFHHADDRDDEWVCPRDHKHRWDHETYTKWIETRKAG